MTTGERIAELRKRNSMTQPMLAEKMSVSQSTITSWENDRRSVGNEDLVKLSKLFNVTTDYLLGNNNTPKWAKTSDILELHDFLTSNAGMAFEGVNLSPEQKQRVNEILTQVFWDEIKKEKNKKSSDKNE